jgi:hypothetical protein
MPLLKQSQRFNMTLPRARQEGLIIKELHDEMLVYDRTRHKAHCLNHTAAAIWRHCDGRSPISDIARRTGKDLGSPVNNEFVWIALKQLAVSELLEETIELPVGIRNLSRRQMMKLGLGAALAVPLVISIIAPRTVEAGSCKPSGQSCVASAQCCSLVCNMGICV